MEISTRKLSDEELVSALDHAVKIERHSSAYVIRCLMEFKARKLYETTIYPSMFDYCVRHLRYSEDEAYKRVRITEAAESFPSILTALESDSVSLSSLVVIAPHLTPANCLELLRKAASLSKRELEFHIAGFAPDSPKRDCVQLLDLPQVDPASPASATAPAEGPSPTVTPAGPLDRVKPVTARLARVSFNADLDTVADLDRACALLHVRRGNLGPLFARALKALLKEVDPAVKAAAAETRTIRPYDADSRRVPAHVRRDVWRRDQGQCTFRDRHGKRCLARTDLHIDHIVPFALGGRSDELENLRLLCRAHNLAEARRRFGDAHVAQAIAAKRSVAATRAEQTRPSG